MNTKTEPFYSWIKNIPSAVYQLDEKPLLGFPPAFPWNAFSTAFAQSMQIPSLSITPGDLQWRDKTDLFNGLGDRVKTLALTITPLEGTVWFAMQEQGITRFMHSLIGSGSSTPIEIVEEDFFKAFYQFLAAEAINALEKTEFDKKLAPAVQKETSLPSEACLCLDISIAFGNEAAHGRLFLSQAFRKAWTERYAQLQKNLALSSSTSDALEVIVHLEAGKVNLKHSEWKQIRQGDFVVLDSCTLDADEDKGRVMLVINGSPFFRAKIKQGSLKILEHPLYHEVNAIMETPPKTNDGHDDESLDDTDFDDTDFDLDESEADTTQHTEESGHDQSSEHTLDTEYDKSSDHHSMESEHDLDTSDEDLSDFADEKTNAPLPSKAQTANEKKPDVPLSNTPLTVDEIPMTVVIEVGRIQMPVKKLLELQPGNMLDLNIHPESGIDMVVNGKRIARGELLKIGDSLGIRIIELS